MQIDTLNLVILLNGGCLHPAFRNHIDLGSTQNFTLSYLTIYLSRQESFDVSLHVFHESQVYLLLYWIKNYHLSG